MVNFNFCPIHFQCTVCEEILIFKDFDKVDLFMSRKKNVEYYGQLKTLAKIDHIINKYNFDKAFQGQYPWLQFESN